MVVFLPFLHRKITFVTFCLLPCTLNPFWGGICSKKKELAPWENVLSFLSRPSMRGGKIAHDSCLAASVFIPINGYNNHSKYSNADSTQMTFSEGLIDNLRLKLHSAVKWYFKYRFKHNCRKTLRVFE